jgi:hypothetical protein
MTITDLKNPVLRILADHDMHGIEKKTMDLCKEGWYPVGGYSQKGHDWIQVMVKEV